MGNFRLEESYGIWSNTMKHFVIISLILSVVFGNTIIVDQTGGGDYLNINDAILNSIDNDTIEVNAGYYIEQLEFNSEDPSLTIIGTGKDVCTLFYSNDPLKLFGYSGDLTFEGFTINWGGAAGEGVFVDSGNLSIRKCAIVKTNISANYSRGIEINGVSNSNISIQNCLINIVGNASERIAVYAGNLDNSIINISNSIMFGCNYGIVCSDTDTDYFIYNNIVINNDIGILVAINVNLVAMYNDVFGNGLNYSNDFVPGAGDISIDPLIVNLESGDYRLGPGSPCVDTGAPWQQFNDIDGSRNDMGIFGGPHNIGGFGPVISNIQVSSEQVEQGGVITIQATGTVD